MRMKIPSDSSLRATGRLPGSRAWSDWGDLGAEFLILAILIGGFFTWGYATSPMARGWVWLGCSILGGWALIGASRGRWSTEALTGAKWVLACFGLVALWAGIQLIPLPVPMTRAISPVWNETHEAFREAGIVPPALMPLAHSPVKAYLSWNQVVACGLFFACVAMLSTRRGSSSRLLLTVALISLVEGILGIASYLVGDVRAHGALYNPNHHAALVILGLPAYFALLAYWRRSYLARRPDAGGVGTSPFILFFAFGALAAIGWLTSISRASLILSGAILTAWGALEGWNTFVEMRGESSPFPRRTVFLAGASAFCATLIVATLVFASAIPRGFAIRGFSDPTIVHGRFELWGATLAGLGETPWIGLGLRGAEAAMNRFAVVPMTRTPVWTHNDYVQLAAELGIPATLGLWLLVGGACRSFFRNLFRNVKSFSSARALPHRAVIVGVLITLAHAGVDFHLRVPLLAFVFLILVALALRPEPLSPSIKYLLSWNK